MNEQWKKRSKYVVAIVFAELIREVLDVKVDSELLQAPIIEFLDVVFSIF